MESHFGQLILLAAEHGYEHNVSKEEEGTIRLVLRKGPPIQFTVFFDEDERVIKGRYEKLDLGDRTEGEFDPGDIDGIERMVRAEADVCCNSCGSIVGKAWSEEPNRLGDLILVCEQCANISDAEVKERLEKLYDGTQRSLGEKEVIIYRCQEKFVGDTFEVVIGEKVFHITKRPSAARLKSVEGAVYEVISFENALSDKQEAHYSEKAPDTRISPSCSLEVLIVTGKSVSEWCGDG